MSQEFPDKTYLEAFGSHIDIVANHANKLGLNTGLLPEDLRAVLLEDDVIAENDVAMAIFHPDSLELLDKQIANIVSFFNEQTATDVDIIAKVGERRKQILIIIRPKLT